MRLQGIQRGCFSSQCALALKCAPEPAGNLSRHLEWTSQRSLHNLCKMASTCSTSKYLYATLI